MRWAGQHWPLSSTVPIPDHPEYRLHGLARMIVDAPSRGTCRPSLAVRVPYSGHGFRWASSSGNSV